MGFVEDEEKMFAERMRAESASIAKGSRRGRRFLWIVLSVVLVGAIFVLKDYFGSGQTDDIYTTDPEVRSQVVDKWTQEKYIISYDALNSTCVFNEVRWYEYSDEDKIAVTTLLDSYYAKTRGAGHSGITMIGSNTGGVIAVSGAGGVKLQR